MIQEENLFCTDFLLSYCIILSPSNGDGNLQTPAVQSTNSSVNIINDKTQVQLTHLYMHDGDLERLLLLSGCDTGVSWSMSM